MKAVLAALALTGCTGGGWDWEARVVIGSGFLLRVVTQTVCYEFAE